MIDPDIAVERVVAAPSLTEKAWMAPGAATHVGGTGPLAVRPKPKCRQLVWCRGLDHPEVDRTGSRADLPASALATIGLVPTDEFDGHLESIRGEGSFDRTPAAGVPTQGG
jgi:hypothetical protein